MASGHDLPHECVAGRTSHGGTRTCCRLLVRLDERLTHHDSKLHHHLRHLANKRHGVHEERESSLLSCAGEKRPPSPNRHTTEQLNAQRQGRFFRD